MTSASIESRVTNLEATTYRSQGQQQYLRDRLDHISGALGDLSQDARGVALDIREMRQDITSLGQQVGEMRESVIGLRQDVTDLKQRFGSMESLMQAIAIKVGAVPE